MDVNEFWFVLHLNDVWVCLQYLSLVQIHCSAHCVADGRRRYEHSINGNVFISYGCEAWSLTLRRERKLRVFENVVLRRIFGPRRDEVMGEWWRLHNEELNDLYSSPNIVRVIKSRRMRWAGHVARMGEERGCRFLVGKPEGKRPLGRPRLRWVDNIRMDLQEVGCVYMDWIGLSQDRDKWRMLVSAVMNLRVL